MDALTDDRYGNYTPNYSYEDKKFLLMFFACAAALIAQFYPMPFPDSRGLIFVCCAVYFIISFILQVLQSFVDKDCILILHPKKDVTSKQTIVRSNFARFQEYFELILEAEDSSSTSCTTAKMYVGKYFTEAGEFDEVCKKQTNILFYLRICLINTFNTKSLQDSFVSDVLVHMERYEQEKYQLFQYDHKSD